MKNQTSKNLKKLATGESQFLPTWHSIYIIENTSDYELMTKDKAEKSYSETEFRMWLLFFAYYFEDEK